MAAMEVQLGPVANNRVDSSSTTDARYRNHSQYDYELHHPHHHHQHHNPHIPAIPQPTSTINYGSPAPKSRKRKAESQGTNERLSKRLGLLNLEKNGHKLYTPVEAPSMQPYPEHASPAEPPAQAVIADDTMQLDDSKHKVYIYDLDAELSSSDEASDYEYAPGSPTSGRDRLIFLPDIEKHISRSRRIPPAVYANRDGELAGYNVKDMQVVLYREPTSLTVPAEQDSVRKAILEARARARQRQLGTHLADVESPGVATPTTPFGASYSQQTFANNNNSTNDVDMASMNGFGSMTSWQNASAADDDGDAMDMD